MCWDSRFAQPDMRAARSPTAPGYTAVGMSLHAQPACECVLGRTLAPTRCPGIRATSPAPASHHATTWCSATRPQSPWSVRRAVGACSSGAFFAPGQMPPAAKGSADTGRASACTLRRKALRRRACAPAAKGSADTNGLRALAVPVKGRDQRHGVRLVELRAGTSWQMLTQSPRQVWAAAVPPAACTPLDTVALSAAGLQSPARGATRRPLAVAAARPSRSSSQRPARPVRWRSVEAAGVLAKAPRSHQLLLCRLFAEHAAAQAGVG